MAESKKREASRKMLKQAGNAMLSIAGLCLTKAAGLESHLRPHLSNQRLANNFSLIMVGAHNGAKTVKLVKAALQLGKVCLVEPSPHLFADLRRRYGETDGLILINACLTPDEVETFTFYAPSQTATQVTPWGDQLGSLNPNHAADHSPKLAAHIEAIEAPALTPSQLIALIGCEVVDLLMLDTEGYDCTLLGAYPVDVAKPCAIIFEHRHADGFAGIGANFAATITVLDDLGYDVAVLDQENCIARLRAN